MKLYIFHDGCSIRQDGSQDLVALSHEEAYYIDYFIKGLSIYTTSDQIAWEKIKKVVSNARKMTSKVTLDWDFKDQILLPDVEKIDPTKLILDQYEGHNWEELISKCPNLKKIGFRNWPNPEEAMRIFELVESVYIHSEPVPEEGLSHILNYIMVSSVASLKRVFQLWRERSIRGGKLKILSVFYLRQDVQNLLRVLQQKSQYRLIRERRGFIRYLGDARCELQLFSLCQSDSPNCSLLLLRDFFDSTSSKEPIYSQFDTIFDVQKLEKLLFFLYKNLFDMSPIALTGLQLDELNLSELFKLIENYFA